MRETDKTGKCDEIPSISALPQKYGFRLKTIGFNVFFSIRPTEATTS